MLLDIQQHTVKIPTTLSYPAKVTIIQKLRSHACDIGWTKAGHNSVNWKTKSKAAGEVHIGLKLGPILFHNAQNNLHTENK